MSDQHMWHLYQSLPKDLKKEVFDFIEFLAQKRQAGRQGAEDASDKRNALGSLKGEVWMAPDFDAPLDDFKEYR